MAEGFLGGLMEGFISQVAPGYFNAMKQEEHASVKEKAKQQQLQNLASMADPYYQGLIDAEKDPRRVALLNSRKMLAKSQNALFAEMWPELVKQDSQELYDVAQPSETIKNVDYLGQLDPNYYSDPIKAKILEQHLVKPQTQISMSQGRPAPASGYTYKSADPNDYNQTYIPFGPADPETKPLTESESKSKGFHMLASQANETLSTLFSNPNVNSKMLAAKRTAEGIPLIGDVAGVAMNSALSPEEQQVDTAKRVFINSVLRRDTGATILPSEFSNYDKTYFDQPSDDKETKAFKAKLRQTAIDTLAIGSGDTVKKLARENNPFIKKPLVPSDADNIQIDLNGNPDEIRLLEEIAKKNNIKPDYITKEPKSQVKVIGGKKFHMIDGKLMVED